MEKEHAAVNRRLIFSIIFSCFWFVFMIRSRPDSTSEVEEEIKFLATREYQLFDSLFYDAGVDVTNFHSCLKMELSRIMASFPDNTLQTKGKDINSYCPTAVVVGVEYGTEVVKLAEMGYNIIGLEPFPDYVAHTLTKAVEKGVLDKVNIYAAAAGAERGKMNVTYYQGTVTAPIVLLDDVVKNRTIDILSVDVHGGSTNLDVLMGGKSALDRGLFRSIWVEIFPDMRGAGIGDWGMRLLSLLQEHDYILYDVRWVGGAKSCTSDGIPSHLCDRINRYDGIRPLDSPKTYMDAMSRVLNDEFQYLQTDVIAMPRLLAAHAKHDLKLAAKKCGKVR